jgi:serine/threonine protein kinase
MQQSMHNPANLQSHLSELQASLDAYLDRNLEFAELRTRWIAELANKPEMGNGALRLLYQQPLDKLLTEERVLSLKRVVETAINEVADDWTVAFDEHGDENSLAVANNADIPSVRAEPRLPQVNRVREARPAATQGVRKPPTAAPQSNPVDILTPGLVLCDRFVLEEPLGRGGIGIVYKARDRLRQSATEGSDRIALKVLRGEFRTNLEWRDALQREALRAQGLSHPNIVRVYDFRQDGETSFVTMELLEGESLSVLFARLQPDTMPTKRAMQIIAGMCRGLAYAHGRDVVHADFKPANVFLTAADEPKILDFGFTGIVTSNAQHGSDNPALRVITPAYASCNRLEGRAPVISDDVYSLCCVIYELLAGHHPYDKRSALVARDFNLQPKRIDGLTDLQWQTLAAGLRPSPWVHTTEVHDIQEAFAEQLPIQPRSVPVITNPVVKEVIVRKRNFAGAVIAIVFGILLGAAIVAGMLLSGIQPVPSKYIDLARESALVQMLQSTFGAPIEETSTAGETETFDLSRDESTNMDRESSAAIADPRQGEQSADTVVAALDPEVTPAPVPDTAAQDSDSLVPAMGDDPAIAAPDSDSPLPTMGDNPAIAAPNSDGALPTQDGNQEPAFDSASAIVSAGDTTASVLSGAPVLHLGRAVYFIHEDGVALAVQVHRQGDVSAPTSVKYMTVPGLADPQLDYAGVDRGLVQFAAGARTQDIFIPIVSDNTAEADEDFLIVLSTSGDELTLAEPFTATVTIIDDD